MNDPAACMPLNVAKLNQWKCKKSYSWHGLGPVKMVTSEQLYGAMKYSRNIIS